VAGAALAGNPTALLSSKEPKSNFKVVFIFSPPAAKVLGSVAEKIAGSANLLLAG
jgi:hypothetical protein